MSHAELNEAHIQIRENPIVSFARLFYSFGLNRTGFTVETQRCGLWLTVGFFRHPIY